MAWFRVGSDGVWRRRAAFSIELAATSPVDANIVIPPEWDEFWDVIDSAGAELRVVSADGRTVLAYAVDDGSGGAFDATARLGRIRIDGMSVPAVTAVLLVWVFFDPDEPQGSGASAVTIASPLTGYLELGRPGQHAIVHQPAPTRSRRPRAVIQKTPDESVFVWVRYDPALGKRTTPGHGSQVHEEAFYASITVRDAAGDDVPTMYDLSRLRWVWSRGQMWLRVRVKGGDDATNYTAVILTATVLPGGSTADQQLETRVGVAVSASLDS